MDYIAVSGLVIAILGGLGTFVNTLHITECEMGCIKSDCMKEGRARYQRKKSSPSLTPTEDTPITLPVKTQPSSTV